MKKMMKFWVSGVIALVMQSQATLAQKIDDERMKRDIEVAENVLSTLIKQEINSDRNWWGLDIKGTYMEGYGVTFRLPGDYATPVAFSTRGDAFLYNEGNGVTIRGNDVTITSPHKVDDKIQREKEGNIEGKAQKAKEEKEAGEKLKLREAMKEKRRASLDSARDEYYSRVIKAAKDFIVDYGDFVSQLGPNERIVVTNQGENRMWVGAYYNSQKRIHISVEGYKADITAFKQGKLTRDQAIAKLKVVNTETVEVKEPEMELMSSIIGRLYRPDLSKTFFTENYIPYERLKDYGVIYYMQVYSSNQGDYGHYSMPTQNLEDIDEATRNKKVVELYPKFEQDLKENILEYGRTLKTLKDEEVLVFNVQLTKCKGCGIPSTLELNVKNSVLKDYSAGKIDKNTGVSKFTVKKGANQ
jgi:hypothetical protein